ncbi:hypothetical protein [Moorena producens]|uniref:hypothetical protein n=1 Tax=Moorena producens TaxID=1155739 RepID=UPI003C7681B3
MLPVLCSLWIELYRLIRYTGFFPCSQIRCSLFSLPYSLFPDPLFPIPYSLFPIPN